MDINLNNVQQQNHKTDQTRQNLESRQIAVYGFDMMSKLMKMKVFIQGLRGVGIETAKNLILAGPAEVVLYDENYIQISDLGSNFYLKEQDVGRATRAEGSLRPLRELNSYVSVEVKTGKLRLEDLNDFNVVVFTDCYDRHLLIQINKYCREKNIGFVYAGNLGLYGFTFVDFGDKHEILDKDGETQKTSKIMIIEKVQNQEKSKIVINVFKETMHGLYDGDSVTFKDVQGMTQLNDQIFKVRTINTQSFSIEVDDIANYQEYEGGGLVQQVLIKQQVNFRSLEKSLYYPIPVGMENDGFYICDFTKFGYAEQFHIILQGILEFYGRNQALPELGNEKQGDQLMNISNEILDNYIIQQQQQSNEKYQQQQQQNDNENLISEKNILQYNQIQMDRNLVQNVSQYARANISPIASFWGGVVTQEIMKFTGKFTPIRQWLHLDWFELLPDQGQHMNKSPSYCRYDDMISIFGKSFVEQLSQQKIFMIGAGALGCEFLKIFALSGVAFGKQGVVTVADDDSIELSNLNRQFLFRQKDINHSKAERAGQAVKLMNANFNVNSIKSKVCVDTESHFNDKFWNSQDIVINAVDNVQARVYIDRQCVWYEKPLIDSGTLGTKGSTQVIIPHVTESYESSQDQEETEIPMCTIKNFPYQPDHCITWARNFFEKIFVEAPNDAQKFVKQPELLLQELSKNIQQQGELRERLENLKMIINTLRTGNYDGFIELARNLFQEVHYNFISLLIFNHPKDSKNSQGLPYWTGTKMFPKPIEFDINDELHMTWIQSAVNIFAKMFNMQYLENEQQIDYLKSIIKRIQIAPFQLRKKNFINETNKNKEDEKQEDDLIIIQQLKKELLQFTVPQNVQINAFPFEKDDPSNWHIDFIYSISNLRARNYNIKELDKFDIKIIAGKIIPALATTTATVVGLVGIEFLKIMLKKPSHMIRISTINLALPMFVFNELVPPKKNPEFVFDEILQEEVKCVPDGFTLWDKINIKGPMKLKQILEHVKTMYSVNIDTISFTSEKIAVFTTYDKERYKKYMEQDFLKLIVDQTGKQLIQNKLFLYFRFEGTLVQDPMRNVIMPVIKYQVQN